MANSAPSRARASHLITADIGDCAKAGTALANYSDSQSCALLSSGTALGNAWGGARNRADRESWYLSRRQAESIIAATKFSVAAKRPFNRHWTVHYERAGIAERDGARFIGHLLRLVAAQARRAGGELAAIWVRENGDGKGGHVHILMHLPAGLSLRNRTRRWIECAGGKYRGNVSKVRSIGGQLSRAEKKGEHYRINLDAVLAYVLKGVDAATGDALGLARYGEGGLVIGKRCGRTQNVG